MTIRLLYFASFRDVAGRDEEARAVPEGTTISDLWDVLRSEIPHFARFPTMPAAAVNLEYVSGNRTLGDNDEVAFLPPVAGG